MEQRHRPRLRNYTGAQSSKRGRLETHRNVMRGGTFFIDPLDLRTYDRTAARTNRFHRTAQSGFAPPAKLNAKAKLVVNAVAVAFTAVR